MEEQMTHSAPAITAQGTKRRADLILRWVTGLAHLFLPMPGRFAAVLWTITGILGFPEFNQPEWGLINAFSVFGGATAFSGAFVLWGLDLADREQISEQPETA